MLLVAFVKANLNINNGLNYVSVPKGDFENEGKGVCQGELKHQQRLKIYISCQVKLLYFN